MNDDSFDSFGAFADHLQMVVLPNVAPSLEGALHTVGEHVVKVAQDKFGTYQPTVYKFPSWAPLAESTKEDRLARGFSENEPLLRTGQTRDSIHHGVKDGELVVGSDEPTMVYHEVGTTTEPPRPVLGPALYQSKNLIREIMGKATVLALVPGSKMEKLLGFKRTGPRLTNPVYNKYKGPQDV